jgi:hypothetical protein
MKVVITSPVEHDGKSLGEGDTADLPETAAQALIVAGAALAVGRKARATKSDEQLAAEAAAAAADDAARAQAAADAAALAGNEGQGT